MRCRILSFHRSFLAFLPFVLAAFSLNAQDPSYTVPFSPILKRLAISRTYNPIINTYNRPIKLLPVTVPSLKGVGQSLMIANHRFYIYFSSTGVLYESDSLNINQKTLVFKRIDRTVLSHYNICCFSFAYKDNIYNIGGYGFWRYNGQLRKFVMESKEWDIIPLKSEVPVLEEDYAPNVWLDSKNGLLYNLSHTEGNQAIESTRSNSNNNVYKVDTLMVLDLASKQWSKKGALQPELVKSFLQTYVIAYMDSGLLVERSHSIEFWNLLNNNISILNKNSNKIHFLHANIYTEKIFWSEKNKLLFGNIEINTPADSIFLEPEDFINTNISVYIPISDNIKFNWKYAGYMAGVSFLGITWLLFRFQQKRGKKIINAIKDNSQPALEQTVIGNSYINNEIPMSQSNQKALFTSVELNLIQLMLTNYKEKRQYTGLDELNKVLGISIKTGNMQKRTRSDVISGINNKYKIAQNNPELILIDRVKSDSDKRIFEYFIRETEVENIEKLIQ